MGQCLGLTPRGCERLKNGRAKAVRFTTLAALCEVLKCQPGDLLCWEPDDPGDRDRAAYESGASVPDGSSP
ncbi:helix-turn-helix domain-containing protein [Streptomyces griseofuscus]|uniref:helix-turn-helix domain-containing protein n=1 Tax=Streptomyces griseofuscus TaxID=146922 RepID=UPI0036A0865F